MGVALLSEAREDAAGERTRKGEITRDENRMLRSERVCKRRKRKMGKGSKRIEYNRGWRGERRGDAKRKREGKERWGKEVKGKNRT